MTQACSINPAVSQTGAPTALHRGQEKASAPDSENMPPRKFRLYCCPSCRWSTIYATYPQGYDFGTARPLLAVAPVLPAPSSPHGSPQPADPWRHRDQRGPLADVLRVLGQSRRAQGARGTGGGRAAGQHDQGRTAESHRLAAGRASRASARGSAGAIYGTPEAHGVWRLITADLTKWVT
jgi:hypothetical protein